MKLYVARNECGARGMSAKLKSGLGSRSLALSLATAMLAPGLVAGCGGNNQASAPPPMSGMNRPMNQPRMQGGGMSGKQKMVLLAGAALAYYLWKRNRDAKNRALPQGVQMYRSRNGGIYYRDPRNPQVPVYVVPPTGQPFNNQLQVSESELQGLNLQQYQGYGGSNNGTGLDVVRGLVPEYSR